MNSRNEVRLEQVILDGKVFAGCLKDGDASPRAKLSLIRDFLHGKVYSLKGQQKTDPGPIEKPKSARRVSEGNSQQLSEREEMRVGVHMQDKDVVVYAYITSHGNLLFRLHADDIDQSDIQFNGCSVRFLNIVFDSRFEKDTEADTRAYIRSKLPQISTPTSKCSPRALLFRTILPRSVISSAFIQWITC